MNALNLFQEWGIVDIREEALAKNRRGKVVAPSGPTDQLVSLLPPYQQESQLQEFVESIARFRKLPINAQPQQNKSLKKILLSEFPVLAKL